jgi:hypothetical protein
MKVRQLGSLVGRESMDIGQSFYAEAGTQDGSHGNK